MGICISNLQKLQHGWAEKPNNASQLCSWPDLGAKPGLLEANAALPFHGETHKRGQATNINDCHLTGKSINNIIEEYHGKSYLAQKKWRGVST